MGQHSTIRRLIENQSFLYAKADKTPELRINAYDKYTSSKTNMKQKETCCNIVYRDLYGDKTVT